MFCALENLHLSVETCPVPCMYRAHEGTCAYEELTDEQVDAQTLSRVTGKKVYKIKAMAAAAKQMIEIGTVIDRYSDFIKETVPRLPNQNTLKLVDKEMVERYLANVAEGKVVNTSEGSGVALRLKRGFNLSDNQQSEFWSEERFSKWSKRSGTSVSLREMRQALIAT